VSDLSLQNAANRIRVPGQADPYDTVFHNFEGALSVSGTLTAGNLDWLRAVTAKSASPYEFQTGTATSLRWFLGADPFAGTAEREAMGVIVPQCTINVEQDSEATFDLTCVYGDEAKNTSLTIGSPIQPTGDPLVFHGGTLSIPSGTGLAYMQSATLTLNSQARLIRGFNRHPEASQMGGHESQIEFDRVYQESDDTLNLAYGGAGATAPTDYPESGVSGSLTLVDSADAAALDATLGDIVPDSYAWQNAGNVNENMLENGTFFVNSPSIAT
jgi:hypothetical protein